MRRMPLVLGRKLFDLARRDAEPIPAAAADSCPPTQEAPGASTVVHASSSDTLGFQRLSLLRVALALAALLLVQQTQSRLFVLLAAYAVYSVAIHALVVYRYGQHYFRLGHWLDVAWGVTVVTASGGNDSIFYLFLLYPVTTASLRCGTREGVGVVLLASAGLLLAGIVASGSDFEVTQWLPLGLHVAVLLLFGNALALWAGFEGLQRRRLQLLAALNNLPNPRFSSQRVLAATLEQLRDFYDADACLAVLSTGGVPRLHRAGETDLAAMDAAAERLLALPEHCAFLASMPAPWRRSAGLRIRSDGAVTDPEAVAELAAVLGAGSWISVPLERAGTVWGRLYVVSRQSRFATTDLWLLRQASEKFMPLVECVELLDKLATSAVATEREKISLDLHDSAIQPYLGLKFGLEALRRKVPANNDLAGDIDELCRMTIDSIAELRGYVGGLGGRANPQAAVLLEGLRRQAERFRGFYGIDSTINLNADLQLNDRLTGELVQMVGEGLSNVGRHTASRRVTIDVSGSTDCLVAQIVNHGTVVDAPWQGFTPYSLTRRAQHLGGSVEVLHEACGGTAVRVTIPL